MRHFFTLSLLAGALHGQSLLTPAWVVLGENGQVLARVVSRSEDCPAVVVDGATRQMSLRSPVPQGLRPLCEFAIPPGTRTASVNGQALALPVSDPARVIVVGDTGCRVKAAKIQSCTDPAEWPFEQVATRAATDHPDLVVHVGDYLYREDTCATDLKAKCGDTPGGDRWEAWDADFFTPAAKLLAAAAWTFARGNHETCDRSWRGFFYYLDPRPWSESCDSYSPPYLVNLGSFELVIFDSSLTKTDKISDKINEEQVAKYPSQLAQIHAKNAWLVVHHPFWGIKTDPEGGPSVQLVTPFDSAWKKARPQGISLIVSGHVHMFQLLSFDRDRPPQLVAGDSGADLAAPFPASVTGMKMSGASVVASESEREFGYTLLSKSGAGWDLTLRNRWGKPVASCSVQGNRTAC